MSISGRAPDQNVEREFLGLGHPEQGGDAPVPLHGGAAPGLGGGGSSLLSDLLQLPVIADEAWKMSISKLFPFHGISYFVPLHFLLVECSTNKGNLLFFHKYLQAFRLYETDRRSHDVKIKNQVIKFD